ncbi:MAG: hypothetical protein ACO3GE_08490 [Steroidobacteraceae bacterium]|jgi:hypothetical protein
MANLFDSANYPTREPTALQAGDLWAWKRTDLVTDYPSSAYSLSYIARREITGEKIAISTTGSTEAYTVSVSSTTTDNYEAGRYHWVAYITRTSDSARIEVDKGVFEVAPNRSTSSADPRSFAQIALDNIETYLKDPTNLAAASYSIAGRSLSRWNRADLLTERERLKGEVTRERRAEQIAKGLGTNATIRVRFTA